MHQSRAGIKRIDLLSYAKEINRTLLALAEILPSSYSTLTKKDIFDKATSEHIIQLKTLYEQGIEVFNDLVSFNTWLDQPVEAYEGASSFSLLDTSFGIKLVSDELIRIDYGLPVRCLSTESIEPNIGKVSY
ncbi:MAG: hypothetical protein ACI9FN_001641 [Saprospiraceae bacterium]